jgi:hypothetical protein
MFSFFSPEWIWIVGKSSSKASLRSDVRLNVRLKVIPSFFAQLTTDGNSKISLTEGRSV